MVFQFSSMSHFWDSGLGPSLLFWVRGKGHTPNNSNRNVDLVVLFSHFSPCHHHDSFMRQTRRVQSHFHLENWGWEEQNENLWMRKSGLESRPLVPAQGLSTDFYLFIYFLLIWISLNRLLKFFCELSFPASCLGEVWNVPYKNIMLQSDGRQSHLPLRCFFFI